MKIGIVVEDTGLSEIDFTDVDKGNPGVGGTVYEEILLANNLSKYNNYEVYLYVTNKNYYSNRLKTFFVDNILEIPSVVEGDGIDILLFCTGKSRKWYEEIEKHQVKCIAWAHGFLNYYELKSIRKSGVIKRLVFVGKYMYYSYIADDIIKKSIFIYNMYNSEYSKKRKAYEHGVCYLGALNRYKGFHILAKAWPLVLRRFPDAKLYVIGRGDLYNRNSSLGNYGIAEKKYENRFIKYLIDNDGKLLPSVIFKGNMGQEKSELISKMCVGVVNPTAITETFCISAIEINACGVPVCTKGDYGLLDTVINNKTGLFSNNYVTLANNIILLMKDRSLNEKMSKYALDNAKRFAPSVIIQKWVETIDEVQENKKIRKINLNQQSSGKIKKILHKIRIEKGIKVFPSFIKYDYLFKNMGRVYFRDLIYHYFGKGE